MKVLVVGVKGMLGTDVLSIFLSKGINTIGYDKSDCDITDRERLGEVIQEESPSHIINCAGYTNVDKAETDRDTCFLLNVTGVENLVSICREKNIKLIQISTDYVFDGTKEVFNENDVPNPINYYGFTKAEAENLLTQNLSEYAIVRTSWLFGKGGRNFVDTILGLCTERHEVKVVDDQIGSPTYTVDLADKLTSILSMHSGIYHVHNDGVCSWFAFAKEIARLQGLGCRVLPCSSSEYPQAAKRPARSVMENNKLPNMRSWQDALFRYLNTRTHLK